MLVLLLALVVAAFWLAIFVGFHAARGESVGDSFRGEFESPPANVGVWSVIEERGREIVEERLLLEENRPTTFLHQRRTRDRRSGAILSVDAERRLPRPRKKGR